MTLLEFLSGNPPTQEEAITKFSDSHQVFDFMIEWRWPDGNVTCPNCGSEKVTWLGSRDLFQCKSRHPKYQFSVKTCTIFEDSPIPLGKWLFIAWLLANHHERISTYEIARNIGITQKSAWLMKKRLEIAFFLPVSEGELFASKGEPTE